MELIGKQIAIETILGQPPELHYPSWYAAQIEKLPPAPPEYLAEQAGILATDADTISRAKAIDICRAPHMRNADCSDFEMAIMMLPPANNSEIPNSSDTISRQAAIDALMKRDKELRNINWYDKPYAEGECRGIDEALAIVSNLPSAQPEIIRCKDCKHWDGADTCDVIDAPVWDNDFCSMAERRTDD